MARSIMHIAGFRVRLPGFRAVAVAMGFKDL